MPSLRVLIDANASADQEIRHDLHRHPELGYEEKRTNQVVSRHLSELGIAHRADLAGGTGLLGFLPATIATPKRTIAIRADMDALPILEDTGVEYCSQTKGVMHACGHDGHTTILMATARALSQTPERPNDVLFLFQPAEEGGAGGQKMCEDGAVAGRVLGRPADVIYGLHGNPWLALGQVSTRVGPIMASATEIIITIKGKGSHAAYPHLGVDPIVVLAQIVTALQTIASRGVNPLDSVVITIGKIDAGVAHNVISDTAVLHGTFRTLNDVTFEFTRRRIHEIAVQTALAFGATAEVNFAGTYPVTVNHEVPTSEFRKVAVDMLGVDQVHEESHPHMGAEDFSFYGREVPACFFFLGLRGPEHESFPNLHAPQFNFNDAAIPTGVELFCRLALTA